MTNPTTLDRRDVAHSTNPIGGKTQIEQEDLAQPLDPDSDRLPAAGQASSIRGVPRGGNPDDSTDDRYGGMPPARIGKASAEREEAEVRGQTSSSGGTGRIDPGSRIPAPVKQDLGFPRSFDKEE